MRIKSQDFATGLLFVAVGIAALWIGADYPMGTPQRPGTGALLWLKAVVADSPNLTSWAWRPAIMITLATIAFALLADRAGLVVTMIVSMTLAALGTPETRWREYLPFAVIMLAIGVSVFIYGLGMPIPILPKNFTWR